MKKDTLLTKLGRNPEKHGGTVNIPTYRASTIIFPTLSSYKKAEEGKAHYPLTKSKWKRDLAYGLGGTPTTFALQEAIAELEGGDAAFVLPSGLAAITLTLLSLLEAGDHLLVPDNVYGPTRRFCNKELKRFGISTTYYDPLIGRDIKNLIQENTRIVFVESPGSVTFEVQDIRSIAKAAKAKGAIVVMDNTWATPLFFEPFKHGVDISIQAVTKYIGGHSDLIMGAIITRKEYYRILNRAFHDFGINASPDDCTTALKGLRTLAVRLRQHEKSALKVAKWLKKRKEVEKVLHPALPDCPGHENWKRDFTGSSGLFSFILDKHYSFAAISNFVDNLELFGIGASWGGYESLVLHIDPGSIRTVRKWEAKGSLIRLHIGLDDPDDLIADLQKGLNRLKKR